MNEIACAISVNQKGIQTYMSNMNFTELKKACLERFFKRTNEPQKDAIFTINGSVLIIAGAGSGKTTVLCNRIANMLLFGNAYYDTSVTETTPENMRFLLDYANGDLENSDETIARLSDIIAVDKVLPWTILAVTFTNKAAAELKDRLTKMNAPADEVWAATFHSACVRILRQGIENIGYNKNFTIYDSDDSLRLIKDCMKELAISDKVFNPREVASKISSAKDKMIAPEDFSTAAPHGGIDYMLQNIKEIYRIYQKRLKTSNALDFDDIINKTVELFEQHPEVLQHWQKRFKYIMVDEYQDTNTVQYRLVSLLSQKYGNLCVVGDEDQSIYRFRGATIQNILSFEDEFNSKVIKLEQNYRSTENILNAANAVIAHNTQRKNKTLWSDSGEGEKITLCTFSEEQSEAIYIANQIKKAKEEGASYSNHVILYRTNAQSRTFELALSRNSIPYRIIGGTKFYDRKEIKDIMAYLSVINNPADTHRLMRIINEPKRSIGDTTQAEIMHISESLGINAIEVMAKSDEFAPLTKKAKTLKPLAEMFYELINTADDRPLENLVDDILDMSGYQLMLSGLGDEGSVRLENIKELKSGMIQFAQENEEHSLSDYLEQIALITDLDNYQNDEDKTVLMTIHSAKGLEFDTVFLVGAEENLFPSYRSLQNPEDIEEERRLAYVAITRAKRKLYITHAKQRLLYGQTSRNKVSRFVLEIPMEYMELNDLSQTTSHAVQKQKKTGYLQQAAKAAIVQKTIDSVSHKNAVTFADGDRVKHKIFGSGIVLSSVSTGNDFLLEVQFDRVGIKKIMANFAKIEKVEE